MRGPYETTSTGSVVRRSGVALGPTLIVPKGAKPQCIADALNEAYHRGREDFRRAFKAMMDGEDG